ncbi:MAG: Uma2 family endonuclease [Lachnospiraceae bacterium]|nr:Uma2 family endonuclease [Lachnospiraceae bacterium]
MEPARIYNDYTEEDYYNLPDDVRAELINGKFYYMASPSRIHQEVVHFFDQKIGNYIDFKDGSCKIYPAPFAVKLFNDKKTIVEPDISVICDPNKLTDKGCSGAPDWIVEIISPSNPAHDYVRKLNLYVDAGVREYWIIDPLAKEVSVYFFEKSPFPVPYTLEDKVKVNIYDDLWIDFQELTKSFNPS